MRIYDTGMRTLWEVVPSTSMGRMLWDAAAAADLRKSRPSSIKEQASNHTKNPIMQLPFELQTSQPEGHPESLGLGSQGPTLNPEP